MENLIELQPLFERADRMGVWVQGNPIQGFIVGRMAYGRGCVKNASLECALNEWERIYTNAETFDGIAQESTT